MTAPGPVVFLHIGAMKTGTTFLQNLMHENKEHLAEAGISPSREGDGCTRYAQSRTCWAAASDTPRPRPTRPGNGQRWPAGCSTTRSRLDPLDGVPQPRQPRGERGACSARWRRAEIHVILTVRDADLHDPGPVADQRAQQLHGSPGPDYMKGVHRARRPRGSLRPVLLEPCAACVQASSRTSGTCSTRGVVYLPARAGSTWSRCRRDRTGRCCGSGSPASSGSTQECAQTLAGPGQRVARVRLDGADPARQHRSSAGCPTRRTTRRSWTSSPCACWPDDATRRPPRAWTEATFEFGLATGTDRVREAIVAAGVDLVGDLDELPIEHVDGEER